MQTVYRTLDGAIFFEAPEAEKHEQKLLAKVKMWNWSNDPTTDTAQARVVHLIGEGAGAAFKAMVEANDDEQFVISNEHIDDEDTGWFYWDEYGETYRYIDSEVIDCFIAATHQI